MVKRRDIIESVTAGEEVVISASDISETTNDIQEDSSMRRCLHQPKKSARTKTFLGTFCEANPTQQ